MWKLKSYTVLTLLSVAAVLNFTAAAEARELTKWEIKTSLLLIDAEEPFSVVKANGEKVSAGGNSELGAAFATEYQWSELIGIELGISYAKSPEVDDLLDSEIGEGPGFLPVTVGANFHLVNSGNFDFYLGPHIAYVYFGDFDLDIDGQVTEFEVDNEFAWGAKMGLNYRIGDGPWSLLTEASFLDVDMTISKKGVANTSTNSFNPVMVSLGLSFQY